MEELELLFPRPVTDEGHKKYLLGFFVAAKFLPEKFGVSEFVVFTGSTAIELLDGLWETMPAGTPIAVKDANSKEMHYCVTPGGERNEKIGIVRSVDKTTGESDLYFMFKASLFD